MAAQSQVTLHQSAVGELHQLQITTDVFASISRAVTQLPVLAVPDLTCVTAQDGWTQAAEVCAGKTVFKRANALLHLHSIRNMRLEFEVGAQETGISSC